LPWFVSFPVHFQIFADAGKVCDLQKNSFGAVKPSRWEPVLTVTTLDLGWVKKRFGHCHSDTPVD